IYATFGSKEGLFKETLVRYTQQGIEQLSQNRTDASSPLEALNAFMKQLIIEKRVSSPSGMCMLAKTVAELTDEQPELLKEAKKSLRIMEGEFEKLIIEAQDVGQVDKEKDSKQLARHIQIQIAGLRAYASASDADLPLEQMIDDVFTHYPF
ncbi:MAG: TetR/AcrR family transcriptional regulator, partial [Photobacterium frigidiphilum]|uniref:TetR/AcrR family transcriptional regulator n=1 Tax=Photobacterium frigidiphilum TaxID=264736 RepID=UPI003001B377